MQTLSKDVNQRLLAALGHLKAAESLLDKDLYTYLRVHSLVLRLVEVGKGYNQTSYQVTMPYIGGCLSVNSMKIVRGGRRTHRNRPEVDGWMSKLASKVSFLGGKLEPPITVRLFGKFRDNRHPDLDNLFKAVCDGLKRGLDIDDRHFIPVSEGFELGNGEQELVITLEGQ